MDQSDKPRVAQDTLGQSLEPAESLTSPQNVTPSEPAALSEDTKYYDWLRLMYSEAWKQYDHEDVQGQARMSIFLAVQTALIAILALVTKPLLDIQPILIGRHRVWVGIGILGLLMSLLGCFSLVVGRIWKQVNKAGRLYLNLRWIPIAAIEKLAKLDRVNLARFEHEWKHQTPQEQETSRPYTSDPDLKELRLDPLGALPQIRGWAAIERTIFWIQVVFWVITVVGFVLFAFTLVHLVIVILVYCLAP